MWWYALDDQDRGPFSEIDFKVLVASGQIRPTDLVWKEGFAGWVTAESVPDLIPPKAAVPPPLPPRSSSSTAGSSTAPALLDHEEALRTFIGKNYEYYANKWGLMPDRKSKSSFNWGGFFLGPLWMVYRKMYLYSWVFVGIGFAIGFLEMIFNVPKSISNATNIALAVTVGIQGNSWYRNHVENKIREVMASAASSEAARAELARRGGISGWVVMLGFIAAWVALVFGFAFLAAYLME